MTSTNENLIEKLQKSFISLKCCQHYLANCGIIKEKDTMGRYLLSTIFANHRIFKNIDILNEECIAWLNRNGNLILRTDSGFGSSDNVEKLLSIPKLKFVTKAYSTVSAKNIAKDIHYSEYTQADKAAWVYELPENNGVRNIIVQTLSSKGKLKYSLLITNISSKDMDAVDIFHFYNKRQNIEAFFKMAKNIYHIKNLRTSKFYGIYGFLWLMFVMMVFMQY